MPAFIVSLRNGRRYTVQAEEVRSGYDGYLELVAHAIPGAPDPAAGKRVVAMFDRNEVVAIVAREHLVSEEPGEVVPHTVSTLDPIPF